MYFSLLKVVLGMVGVQSGMFGVLWQILCLRVFWCILGVFYVYIESTFGYFGYTFKYIQSNYVGYGCTLGYVGSALACIAFASILVNIKSLFGYIGSTLRYIESILAYIVSTFKYIESTLGHIWNTLSYVGYVGSALACIAFASIVVNI